MNTGGEVAGIVASVYADLGKKGIELGSKLLSYILLGALKRIEGKLNTGQISMKRMLESGDELKQIKINTKDAKTFIDKAKKAGLTFALFDKIPDDNMYTLVFKLKDQEIVSTLMKGIAEKNINDIETRADNSIIDEYLISGGNDIYIVDKNNPENYIATNVEKTELSKGCFVNTKNPDEFIVFNENINEKSLSIEIHNNDSIQKFETPEIAYDEIKSKMSDVINKWEGIELIKTEEERAKLKEKIKEERLKREEHGDKKTMQEVEKEVNNIRGSQPSKDKEAKAKSTKEKAR